MQGKKEYLLMLLLVLLMIFFVLVVEVQNLGDNYRQWRAYHES